MLETLAGGELSRYHLLSFRQESKARWPFCTSGNGMREREQPVSGIRFVGRGFSRDIKTPIKTGL